MTARGILIGLAVAALSSHAISQDLVGTSIVNGRPVQLMSDFTWKYVTAAPANCQSIQDNVSFCGQNLGWTPTGGANQDGVLFRLNDHIYGKIIVEELGRDDGFTEDGFRGALIQNAADGAKIQPKDVATLDGGPVTVDGVSGFSLTYFVKPDGLPAVFTNTALLDKHRAIQIITYGMGSAVTNEMKAAHKAFVEATHLK